MITLFTSLNKYEIKPRSDPQIAEDRRRAIPERHFVTFQHVLESVSTSGVHLLFSVSPHGCTCFKTLHSRVPTQLLPFQVSAPVLSAPAHRDSGATYNALGCVHNPVTSRSVSLARGSDALDMRTVLSRGRGVRQGSTHRPSAKASQRTAVKATRGPSADPINSRIA